MSSTNLQQRIRRYYDENQVLFNAFWTDRRTLSMNYGFWPPGTRRLRDALASQQRAIAERLRVRAEDRVLDAGCGVGGTALFLTRAGGARTVGVTLSPRQVRQGARNARRQGLAGRARFLIADFTRAGFRADVFDGVVGSESICHAERKEDFAREAFRLLRPGGRLVVVDGFLARANLDAEEARLYGEWCEGWVLPNLATVDGFATALREAGFADVRFEDRTAEVMPSARRIRRIGRAMLGPLRLLNRLGLAPASQVAHAVACLRQHDVLARRIGLYLLFSAVKPPAGVPG